MTGFLKQAWLVVSLAVVLSSAVAAVDRSLQSRIKRNADQQLQKAILAVVPSGSGSEKTMLAGRTVFRVFAPTGEVVGWAVPAETMGFQDRIKLLVGFASDGETVRGVVVLHSKETPGLGEKIRNDKFRSQFAGMPTDAPLEVVKPGQSSENPIHAITGATISTTAVTEAVNKQLLWVREAIASHANRNLSETRGWLSPSSCLSSVSDRLREQTGEDRR